jgi:glutamyl-tRNA synthetase
MEKIKTRFAPSPTGYLHVGGARTALFNWLYARHTEGRFVLRIEDTDAQRSTKSSVDAIFRSLEWMGIDWDEGPYFQSERFDIYKEYLKKLVDSGHAYYCTCSPDQIEAMRKKKMAEGGKAKYDGTCRNRGLGQSSNAVIRFKSPVGGTTLLKDMIKGNILFDNSELDDFIIARSDGAPTYNFVVVADDITMGINNVIRGDDHVMNSPKQILLYRALNSPLPAFGHVPMVLGKDRARLSKRHGAESVTAYKDMGYLPDAFINYLVRLGWSYKDQEFFSRDELIEKFTIENIGKSPGIFDMDKLRSLNAEHIKSTTVNQLSELLLPFLKQKGIIANQKGFLEKVVSTLTVRSKTLEDMAEQAQFYFQDQITYDEKAAKKFLKPASNQPLNLLVQELEALSSFDEEKLENAFKAVMEASGLKLGKIAQPVRVALTGKTASPGIFEIISVLGKEKVIDRLKKGIRFISDSNILS